MYIYIYTHRMKILRRLFLLPALQTFPFELTKLGIIIGGLFGKSFKKSWEQEKRFSLNLISSPFSSQPRMHRFVEGKRSKSKRTSSTLVAQRSKGPMRFSMNYHPKAEESRAIDARITLARRKKRN